MVAHGEPQQTILRKSWFLVFHRGSQQTQIFCDRQKNRHRPGLCGGDDFWCRKWGPNWPFWEVMIVGVYQGLLGGWGGLRKNLFEKEIIPDRQTVRFLFKKVFYIHYFFIFIIYYFKKW